MLIGTKQQLSKVNLDSLTVGSIDVAPVTCGKKFRDMVLFYRKIHYLTMEFRVKLHAKKDIDNRCQNRHRVSKREARSVPHV